MNSRSSASRNRSLILLVVAILLLASGPAWARKRIAVLAFEGKGVDAQKTVTDAVARTAAVISDAAWKKAQKKLRVSGGSADAVARTAAEIQADAVVHGSVERTGAEWGLTVTILDGRTGRVSDTLSFPLRSPRLDSDSRKAIARDVGAALARVGEPAVEVAPEPPAPVDTARPPVARTEAPPAVDVAPEAEPETKVTSSSDGSYARNGAVDLDAGVGFQVRSLSFTYAADLAMAQRPNGYNGSAVPSLIADAELYPFAFGGKTGGVAGLGFAASLEKVLLIKSRLGTSGPEYGSDQTRFGGGLRWRINLGDQATAPTLKILAGANRLAFSVDRGTTDLGFPDVAYLFLDLGLAARVPLGTPSFAVRLAARWLQVLDTGEITTKNFYGSGGCLGVDAELALEYVFAGRGVVRLGGRYQRFAFDFDGNGKLSNKRDPAIQDVGGATDQYLGGSLTAGYLF